MGAGGEGGKASELRKDRRARAECQCDLSPGDRRTAKGVCLHGPIGKRAKEAGLPLAASSLSDTPLHAPPDPPDPPPHPGRESPLLPAEGETEHGCLRSVYDRPSPDSGLAQPPPLGSQRAAPSPPTWFLSGGGGVGTFLSTPEVFGRRVRSSGQEGKRGENSRPWPARAVSRRRSLCVTPGSQPL